MTDYIIDTIKFLDSKGIDYDYDDDRSYYDGYDDVFIIIIKDERYKLVQNKIDGKYKNFTLYSNNDIINEYENVIKYFIEKFNI